MENELVSATKSTSPIPASKKAENPEGAVKFWTALACAGVVKVTESKSGKLLLITV